MTFIEFFDIYANISDDARIEIARIVNNFQVDPFCQGEVSESDDINLSPLQQTLHDNRKSSLGSRHEVEI